MGPRPKPGQHHRKPKSWRTLQAICEDGKTFSVFHKDTRSGEGSPCSPLALTGDREELLYGTVFRFLVNQNLDVHSAWRGPGDSPAKNKTGYY